MSVTAWKRLSWALLGTIPAMLLFVPLGWVGQVLFAGLIAFGICFGIAALAIRPPKPPMWHYPPPPQQYPPPPQQRYPPPPPPPPGR